MLNVGTGEADAPPRGVVRFERGDDKLPDGRCCKALALGVVLALVLGMNGEGEHGRLWRGSDNNDGQG